MRNTNQEKVYIAYMRFGWDQRINRILGDVLDLEILNWDYTSYIC